MHAVRLHNVLQRMHLYIRKPVCVNMLCVLMPNVGHADAVHTVLFLLSVSSPLCRISRSIKQVMSS